MCYLGVVEFTEASGALRPVEISTNARHTMIAVGTTQFGVQPFADTARGLQATWRVLVICRVFFIGWGLFLAAGFMCPSLPNPSA